MGHNKLWTILKEIGVLDYLTCLLISLYTGQEATVRTRHGTTDWFQIGKGVRKGYILSPCLFNFYAEYIMQNARLDEAQAGIKIVRRNINNIRYADDEFKSLIILNDDLKFNIWKTKIMASGPITSCQIDEETAEKVTDFIFLGSKITEMMTAAMKLKDTCFLEEKL